MIDITRKVFAKHSIPLDSQEFKRFWDEEWSIVLVQDEHISIDDLEGDTYKPELHPHLPAEQVKKEQRAFRRRIHEEGVYGAGIAIEGQPKYESFVWGFVGEDAIGSGYDTTLLSMMKDGVLEL